MATRNDKEKTADKPNGKGARKIRWDDSNMRSLYANVCNVAGTQEEVVLLFGMNQAWHSDQEEVTIQLADRIVLSPFVAKRMSILLSNVIKNYEMKYGSLDVEKEKTG
jgi:hypothetical protein